MGKEYQGKFTAASEFTPHKSSGVCSDHFNEKDKRRAGGKVLLESNAVPTIFKNVVCAMRLNYL